jgi:hypothetical protein
MPRKTKEVPMNVPMEELRKNPILFFKQVLGIKLHPCQERVLEAIRKGKRIYLFKGRGSL